MIDRNNHAPSDAEERRRAVETDASVIVQAPAGSGKTTLLTQRFLRMLSRAGAPERVLALTFTRRAAQEMRIRVIHALNAARGTDVDASLDTLMLEYARAALRRFDAQGIDLTSDPSRLRIETIDGFNAWLAAQLPLSTGIGVTARIAEHPRGHYREAARRALDLASNADFADAVNLALDVADQQYRRAQMLLADALESRAEWLPVTVPLGFAARDGDKRDVVRALWDADLRALIELFLQRAWAAMNPEFMARAVALLEDAARSSPTNALPHWHTQREPLEPSAGHQGRWRELAAVLLKRNGEVRASVNKHQGFTPGSKGKASMHRLLAELASDTVLVEHLRALSRLPDSSYSDLQWTRARAVAQVLTLAAAELEQIFRERGECDFTAISLAAARALGGAEDPTDLALRLDYSIEHLLIDEFQDVSRDQLQLLRMLTAGWQANDGRTVFCVGDPMQAIYGFRAAEVRAFLELAQDGLGNIRFEARRLTSNFRSTSALIDWVNGVFARIFPARDDRFRGAVSFSSSTAGRASAAQGAVHRALFRTMQEEAAHIAMLLARRRLEEPHWRMAVLVRTRRHAAGIVRALEAQGVVFEAPEIRAPLDQIEISDVLALTRALLHAADRVAWLALLRTPFIGLKLADVLVLAAAPSIAEAIADPAVAANLSGDGKLRVQRLARTLEQARGERAESSLGRWVERVWLALGGAASGISDRQWILVRQVFARLNELDALALEPTALHEAFLSLPAVEREKAPIEVLTIHKAKGAEFDLVIVPRLARKSGKSEFEFLQHHVFEHGARSRFAAAARHSMEEGSDTLFDFLRSMARDAQKLESERLLYVACTRAKSELWLTASLDQSADATSNRVFAPHGSSMLKILWAHDGQQFALIDSPSPAAPDTAVPPTLAAAVSPKPWRLPADWRPEPPLHRFATAALAVETAEADPPFDWASETARQIGILVHRELASTERVLEAAEVEARRAIYWRWLVAQGVPDDQLDDAAAQVCRALIATCRDPRGRWILTRSGDNGRETRLSAVLDNRIVSVAIDRMFVDAGIRWIIDYKTSRHQGSSVERFLENEAARYAPQLRRYARVASKLGPEPIRLGLYFPLLSGWREWPADREPTFSSTTAARPLQGELEFERHKA